MFYLRRLAMIPAPARKPAPVFGIKIPPGYRDWKLIPVAHEEGKLNDLRAILGNNLAIKAYRRRIGKGRLRFRTAPSLPGWLGNTSHLRKTTRSLVVTSLPYPAPPTPWYLQFMVKDSKVRSDRRLGVRSI